jgi:hypothetical protein
VMRSQVIAPKRAENRTAKVTTCASIKPVYRNPPQPRSVVGCPLATGGRSPGLS